MAGHQVRGVHGMKFRAAAADRLILVCQNDQLTTSLHAARCPRTLVDNVMDANLQRVLAILDNHSKILALHHCKKQEKTEECV